MKAIEQYKPELEGALPKDEYFRLTRDEKTKTIPNQLLKNFANIPSDFTGDLVRLFSSSVPLSLSKCADLSERAGSIL